MNNKNKMKTFHDYLSSAIISLIGSIVAFTIFIASCNYERKLFINSNRSTIPDTNLEQIKSPTAFTLSFNRFYHLDSIQLHDNEGKQVLNISTICYNVAGVDYSQISAENYQMNCPYNIYPFDEEQQMKMHIIEILSGCDYVSYQKMYAPMQVSFFDYLCNGLPMIYEEKVYKPLLRNLFGQKLYIRTSSPTSIIKAITLNQVGKITAIHLYNGETLNLINPQDKSIKPKTYEEFFLTSITEDAKKNLVKSYRDRLNVHFLRNYEQEAEALVTKHIEEINQALLTEKVEFLCNLKDNENLNESTRTSNIDKIIGWRGIGVFFFILFVILLIIAHKKKRVQTSEKKQQQQSNINYTQKEIEQLSQALRDLHQLSQSSTIKSVELQKHYPNGWNIIHQKYPKYSDLQMLSQENEIILAEKQFQEKGTAINAVKSGKLKNEKETIEQNLQLLSQATKTGNIELAETKVKELNNIVERTTIDTELAKTIEDTQKEYRHQYNIGIADTFDISYVDYPCPPRFMQGDNWKYAVAKFPSMGSLVFPYRRRKIARRGYIEDTFQNYLTNEFSRAKLLVLGDCAILPADNYRPYEPDIAIIDVEHPSIRIDIEIDEPYSAITNKPIHYIGCGDDFRDMNLTNLGWIVVRFTEYQVKCDMQSCASFIAQLIYTINPSKSIPQSLLIHAIPQTQKRWTEIEAKVMASEKVREQYLNHQFGFVETEQIEIADITQTEREKFCAKSVKPLMVTPNLTLKTTKDEDSNFERDNHIQFLPQEHIYLYNGQEQFTPVSNVISCFFKPFDSYYWSEYKANQRHVPQGQILEEWDSKSTCSREVGTFMHQQIENYYNGRTYQREFTFTYNGTYIQENDLINIEHEYLQFKDFLKDHDFSPFRTEWAIYDEELKIAGTIDMIHKHEDFFDIYDWKRSSRILDLSGNPIAQNNYGEKGLDALCHIEDTPYWHYCIQQNLYRYIVERNYGIKVGNMYLIVFCSNINTYKKLDVPRMDDTIAAIVKACKTGVVRAKLLSSQQ